MGWDINDAVRLPEGVVVAAAAFVLGMLQSNLKIVINQWSEHRK